MIAERLKARLQNFYRLFIAPPKQWRAPKHSQILIYDGRGADLLQPYLEKYSVDIMHLQGESINIPLMLWSVLNKNFWKGKLIQAYSEAFIKKAAPKVVLTFIDNNPNYYLISGIFPDVKTIFLQNGARGGGADVFASIVQSDKYHVDYMLTFNQEVGKTYQKYISGESVVCGSFKNNHKAKLSNALDGTVIFLSQFRPQSADHQALYVGTDGKAVYWEDFYAAESQVLRFLARWCSRNNVTLQVSGCMPDNNLERDFFSKYLSECAWEYIPRTGPYSSYELVDKAAVVVFIDSTLGLESIGRGKKVAAFSCRSSVLDDDSLKFGWPVDLPDNGPFWTNDADELQFLRVMDYVYAAHPAVWERVRQRYADNVMSFDPGNTRFMKLLEQLIPEPTENS
jgi:surface carbohydrate biosynthesis protein